MPGKQTQAEDVTLVAVARAEMMLSLLSQQAAAARAEAEYAELRLLLDEARAGDAQRLVRWLEVHRSHSFPPAPSTVESTGPSLTPPTPLVTHGSPQLSKSQPSYSIASWEQLLPAARERLRRNAINGASGQGGPSTVSHSPHELETNSIESMDVEATERQQDKRDAKKPIVTDTNSANATFKQPLQPVQPRAKQAPDRAQVSAVEQAGPVAAPSGQHRGERRLRGVLASVVFHLVLVLFLAFFTLRMPVPPASLALDATASELPTETVELSQPLEVDAPQSPVEPEATPPVMDAMELAASLEATSSMLSSALLDVAPAGATLLTGASTAGGASAMRSMDLSSTFFGAAAGGNCFCYVIDSSASMRNGPWEAAKSELLRSLSSLKEKQRFYIVFFNRQLSALPLPGERQPAPYALYATPENLQHTRIWIDSVRIELGAPPNAALELAISKEPDAIYLLTDGDTQVDVVGFLRRQNRVQDLIFGEQVRVPVHAIAYYSLAGQALLKQIAAENNGQFIYVPDPRKR